MAVNTIYDVIYEFGDKVPRHDLVIASSGDAATIATVLTANNRKHTTQAAPTITAIKNLGTALS